jgi:iron complex transport system substrate-binding protein
MDQEISEILIWDSVNIKVLDVRRREINQHEKHVSYVLPTTGFIFTTGQVQLYLDDMPYETNRFSIFHGRKDTRLSILAGDEKIEFFMVLYRSGTQRSERFVQPANGAETNPFRKTYGLTPENPIFYLELLRRMHTRWQTGEPLDRFYVKGAFYQLVYEIYEVITYKKHGMLQPDIVLMCQSYMKKHYLEVISIKTLADNLNVSYSQLIRNFKKKTGQSPQEYLTGIKIESACRYLEETTITIKDIANSCGFYDEYHFSNLFKKHMGISPTKYRKKVTSTMIHTSIADVGDSSYNEEGLRNLINLTYEKGEISMIKKMKQHAAFAAALSLVLLMSGCSAPAGETNSQRENSVQQEQDINTDADTAETKVVETLKGEVEVPVNPQRIVIGFFQGDLLKLGIKPVGSSFNDDAVFEGELSDVTVVDPWGLDAEQVMSLEPDLIIWNNPDEYDTLSKIAPTVVMDYYSMAVDERVTFLGELVGRKEQAETALKEFHDKVDAGKKAIADSDLQDKTVILLENQTGGSLRAFGDNYGRGGELIYQYLGLKAPQRIMDEVIGVPETSFIDISYEALPQYEADFIFSDEMIVELEENTVWKSLKAVKEDRLIQTNSGMFWFSDITSMNAQLDFILENLLAAAK